MPSRFLTEIGYDPYGSVSYHDEDADGFTDEETDFRGGHIDLGYDPFPPDVPVWE